MAKQKPIAPAARPGAANTPAAPAKQLTCFVVTGFGNKTDYATGRVLNLDKTFEQLVRPACDLLNINCFRAIDANLTGSIDAIMYRWIYEADLVIADLSTLNANVCYELGVRHAQKPNTTIMIAESMLMSRIPFDLGTFVIHKYEHGGSEISEAVRTSFVAHLSDTIRQLLDNEQARLKEPKPLERLSDSPVFRHLRGMEAPQYRAQESVLPPPYVPPELRPKKKGEVPGESLVSLIDHAEAAKKAENYEEAIKRFKDAIQKQTGGSKDVKPDLFLVQRLALVTYKHGERKGADGTIDKAVAIKALNDAEAILAEHCEPDVSTDPETLGLSGAINKRLYELELNPRFLERSLQFYERGFYVKGDYYNGINVAFLYTLRANLQHSRYDAIVSFGHANMVRRRVVQICEGLMKDKAFAARGDKAWVYSTLAEAYQGLGNRDDETLFEQKFESLASDFDRRSYREQRGKLQAAIEAFNLRARPHELDAAGAAVVQAAPPAPVTATATTSSTAVRSGPGQAITIDPNLLPGRTVKSIEVHCKVEYS